VEKYSERRDSMTSVWVDLETTGLEPIDSGAFEIAMAVYRDSQLLEERVFHLNPLDDEVLYHEDAFKVHGVSEEEIKSFPPAAEVIPQIVEFLKKYLREKPEEKLVFAGYNCPFDWGHIGGIFYRNGFLISDYFSGKFIDVYEKVKKARNLLPQSMNRKLETMTKALGIEHTGAHGALSDIKATRRLYEAIYLISRRNGL
jgi:DNA polymerase III epsilon subunit-like protein